jgi:hypothetical protein
MVSEPGVRRKRVLAESPPFKTLLKDPADVPRPELVEAVRDLAIALEAQGWTPVPTGTQWYSLRFIWTRAGSPPGTEGDR